MQLLQQVFVPVRQQRRAAALLLSSGCTHAALISITAAAVGRAAVLQCGLEQHRQHPCAAAAVAAALQARAQQQGSLPGPHHRA